MAPVKAQAALCSSLFKPAELPCAWPFRVVHCIDEHLGLTDGLIQCGCCGQYNLLELTQWPAGNVNRRTMRLLTVGACSAERFLTNVARDYCDLQRHHHELHALQVAARLAPWLLTIDVSEQTIVEVNKCTNASHSPLVSWRLQES